MSPFLTIFFKFFVVGGLGFGLDMGSTWLFKEKLKLKKYTANSLGFFVGILFRFVLNKFWAFQDSSPFWYIQLFKFGLIAAVGLVVVNYIIYLLTEKHKLMPFYRAKIVAMMGFMVWNFTANYFWTFTG